MLSLYDSIVPVARQALVNLRDFTAKGAAHFEAAGEPEAALIEARLAPDMFSFALQIRSVCHMAEWALANLSGTPGPQTATEDSDLGGLFVRIDRTIALLDTASKDIVDGRADREIAMPIPGNRALHFANGADYVGSYVLPNLFFHSSIAYAILRHRGAPLGKIDFLGPKSLDIRAAG